MKAYTKKIEGRYREWILTPYIVTRDPHLGPVVVLYPPHIQYYLRTLTDKTNPLSEKEELCIDTGGRNFSVRQSVYVKVSEILALIGGIKVG